MLIITASTIVTAVSVIQEQTTSTHDKTYAANWAEAKQMTVCTVHAMQSYHRK